MPMSAKMRQRDRREIGPRLGRQSGLLEFAVDAGLKAHRGRIFLNADPESMPAEAADAGERERKAGACDPR